MKPGAMGSGYLWKKVCITGRQCPTTQGENNHGIPGK